MSSLEKKHIYPIRPIEITNSVEPLKKSDVYKPLNEVVYPRDPPTHKPVAVVAATNESVPVAVVASTNESVPVALKKPRLVRWNLLNPKLLKIYKSSKSTTS